MISNKTKIFRINKKLKKRMKKENDKKTEYFSRFPLIFRKELLSGSVSFPSETIFSTKNEKEIVVYRGITRKDNNKKGINKGDFKSQADRYLIDSDFGIDFDKYDIANYSCSVFTKKEELMAAFKLPRKNKEIIKGTIKCKCGPYYNDKDRNHIDWWLFEKSDPSPLFKEEKYE